MLAAVVGRCRRAVGRPALLHDAYRELQHLASGSRSPAAWYRALPSGARPLDKFVPSPGI